jgi:hypothetical protein
MTPNNPNNPNLSQCKSLIPKDGDRDGGITNRLLYQLSYLGSVIDCNIAAKKLSNRDIYPDFLNPAPQNDHATTAQV